MRTVVAFVSQKGGVGKSTLARGLAREAAAGGLRVVLADLDVQQGTSVDWNKRRWSRGLTPAITVTAFDMAAQALETERDIDLLIIDGPARTSRATFEIAETANLVIQPSGVSLDDLVPAVREFHALVKAGIPPGRLAFALNRVGTFTEGVSARSYLERAGYKVLDGGLRDRAAYRQAQNSGRTITETHYRQLNEEADDLIQSIIDRIATYD